MKCIDDTPDIYENKGKSLDVEHVWVNRRDLIKKKSLALVIKFTLYIFFIYLILLLYTHTQICLLLLNVFAGNPTTYSAIICVRMLSYWWRGLSKSLLFPYTSRPVCPADVRARIRPRVVVVIGSSTPSHYINYSAINGSRGSAGVETGRKRYVHMWFASSRSSRRHSSLPQPLFRVGEERERERARVGSTFSGGDTIQTPFLIWFFFRPRRSFGFSITVGLKCVCVYARCLTEKRSILPSLEGPRRAHRRRRRRRRRYNIVYVRRRPIGSVRALTGVRLYAL